MNIATGTLSAAVFDTSTRQAFGAAYPETPLEMAHHLPDNALFSLGALAHLAETLPSSSVHFNGGDLSIDGAGERASTAVSIGDAIRNVDTTRSWAVLKNIEQAPEYRSLLEGMLDELRPQIEPKTGPILHMEGWVFVSSPDAVTPFHFDPEHNILMQLKGKKEMAAFPAGDRRFASDEAHEKFYASGHYELDWDEALAEGGIVHSLAPGDAIYVPVKAPHYVRNGPAPSISLSVTWRSQWSFDEADAQGFNGWLRRRGITPAPTTRWPESNRAKALAWRVLRKLGAKAE